MGYSLYYFLSAVWGGCILTSFIGWGSLGKRVCFWPHEMHWPEKAVVGIAFSIFVGGLLNVLGLISITAIVFYVITGLFCFFQLEFSFKYFQRLSQRAIDLFHKERVDFFLILAVGLLLILHYLIWAAPHLLINLDDHAAYGISPHKMLEQGSLGYEPFSERRMHALGGQSFLYTLPFSVFLFHSSFFFNFHVLDPGITSLIMAALLWEFSKELRIPKRFTLIFIISLLCLPLFPFRSLCFLPKPTLNLTSYGTAIVVVICLIKTFKILEVRSMRLGQLLLVALLISALGALKSNLFVFSFIYLISFYTLQFFLNPFRKNSALQFTAVLGIAILFLLPWLISSYQSSGTLLYPLLGRGFHNSAYGISEFSPITLDDVIKWTGLILMSPPMVFLMIFYIFCIEKTLKNEFIWVTSIYITTLASMVVIGLFTHNPFSYGFTFLYSVLLVLILFSFVIKHRFVNSLAYKYFYIFFILFISYMFIGYFDTRQSTLSKELKRIQYAAVQEQDEFKKVSLQYLNAQNSVPEGSAILARTENAFLFNFKRNPVYLADYLILGPRPGMPIAQGGEAVAQYLLSKGIRYVMNSYIFFKNDSIGFKDNAWVDTQIKLIQALQNDLMELKRTKTAIYDNGDIYVLDLAKSKVNEI